MLPRILLGDANTGFTNDDAQLALVIQRVGHFRVRVDLGIVAGDGR